ncbi:hypothetical protein GL50803_006306 [Giardia duodenalis]|uniref:Uncharacterized protein n=1 Tax=Giardia intestinalis (strain ATCC 50803 / WB clone C6) TaxID=184922 RepID=A8B274_GIAIC|nr:hypothetical protein GL50803_006306 [Giardia intestinalis]KAE8302929.1 hypothetical protein GL50803_006306 [Giardia intestinalis]|eukprot:XP_001709912.1 Hypothetical protein GL50803_6306 [Giardia lamblia ATCC 50803]
MQSSLMHTDDPATQQACDTENEVEDSEIDEHGGEASESPALLQSDLPVENENWWYTDGSYHLKQTTMPKPLHFAKPHHTIDPLVTFKSMPAPTHVTLSPGLGRLMRNTMENGASTGHAYGLQFDDLFKIDAQARPHVDMDALMKEKRLKVTMNAVRYPRQSAYQVDVNDRDNSLSSVATDESFQLCEDKLNDGHSYVDEECEENPNYEVTSHGGSQHLCSDKVSTRLLLEEVDEHLMHLKSRLRTMSARGFTSADRLQDASFGKGKYNGNKRPKYDRLTISMSGADGTYEINGQDFEEAVRMVSKAPPRKWKRITPDAAMLGKNYSAHPTPDAIELLNRRILNEIDRRDIIAISELQTRNHINGGEKLAMATIPRQAGGSNTAMIKRTTAPFRKTGRLRGRSLPLTIARAAVHGDSSGCRITSYGEEMAPAALLKSKAESRPFDFSMLSGEIRSGQRTSITRVGCLPHIAAKSEAPLCRPVTAQSIRSGHTARDTATESKKQSSSLDLEPQVTLPEKNLTNKPLISIPDETYYELNLLKKDDLDMTGTNFDAISNILAQLRADEQHLVTILRDTEGVRTNYPIDAWHASKGGQFSTGLAQTNSLLSMRAETLEKIARYRQQLGIIEQEDIAKEKSVALYDQKPPSVYVNERMNTVYPDTKYVSLSTGDQHIKDDTDAEALIQRILSKNLCTNEDGTVEAKNTAVDVAI